MRMSDVLLQIFLSWAKFFIAAGQSLSAANITFPRYLKEVTISKGRP